MGRCRDCKAYEVDFQRSRSTSCMELKALGRWDNLSEQEKRLRLFADRTMSPKERGEAIREVEKIRLAKEYCEIINENPSITFLDGITLPLVEFCERQRIVMNLESLKKILEKQSLVSYAEIERLEKYFTEKHPKFLWKDVCHKIWVAIFAGHRTYLSSLIRPYRKKKRS